MIKGRHILVKVIVITALFLTIRQCISCIVSPSTSDTEFKLGNFKYRLLMLNDLGEDYYWIDLYLENAEKMSCYDFCLFMDLFFKNYKLEKDAFYDLSTVDSILQNYEHHKYTVEVVGTNVLAVYNAKQIEALSIKNGNLRCLLKNKGESCELH